jgi:hypothetical protein
MPESTMDARSGVYALAVSAALVMASGAMLSDDAMAQAADDVTVQGDATPVETDVAAVQDEAVDHPLPKQKPAVIDRPVKSDLNQSAVRAAPVTRSPRPTRTSTRAIALPKILGSYR